MRAASVSLFLFDDPEPRRVTHPVQTGRMTELFQTHWYERTSSMGRWDTRPISPVSGATTGPRLLLNYDPFCALGVAGDTAPRRSRPDRAGQEFFPARPATTRPRRSLRSPGVHRLGIAAPPELPGNNSTGF